MGVDAKKVLSKVRLKGEESKQRVTLYLDKERYIRFKNICENATLSHVVEELIQEFIDSAEKEPKKK